LQRHCEEQRDEAIHSFFPVARWIASLALAMTPVGASGARLQRATFRYFAEPVSECALRTPPKQAMAFRAAGLPHAISMAWALAKAGPKGEKTAGEKKRQRRNI
jgi:hypothetical protein